MALWCFDAVMLWRCDLPSAFSRQQPAAVSDMRFAYTVPIVIDTPLFEKPPFLTGVQLETPFFGQFNNFSWNFLD